MNKTKAMAKSAVKTVTKGVSKQEIDKRASKTYPKVTGSNVKGK